MAVGGRLFVLGDAVGSVANICSGDMLLDVGLVGESRMFML